ncbi:hypothetical protein GGI25_006046 [Coemansia spiralis]|uniref:Monopolin complex subunit Csm1/Pcs1 C-terminal domain-containing protein n=2 Tax=Coemansia TaxID=4863 RepID=A0A9W8FXL0_9FUNG|nr:hypothetical protein EDC05_005439 [Coemansia umbellata]KAJ2619790.1 hypothetical protein GGI26_005552 [Coemansia sp. RSA 1358]KAJ2669759.1 hypothetical protein GGI25_006046 [Coemansia spiralis]
MPPRKSRKAAQTPLSAVRRRQSPKAAAVKPDTKNSAPRTETRGRKPATKVAMVEVDQQPAATPTRRSMRSAKEDESAIPPDTVGITRRTRKSFAENIPEQSLTATRPRRSPQKAKATAKEAPTSKVPRGRPRKGSSIVSRKSPDIDAEDVEPNEQDSAQGIAIDQDLQDDSDSFDDVLLATPTRKRGSARLSSLAKGKDASDNDSVFVEILSTTPQPEKAKPKQPAKRGRKRKTEVAEVNIPDVDTAQGNASQQTPTRGRRQKRLRGADEISGSVAPGEQLKFANISHGNNGTVGASRNVYVDIISPSKFAKTRSRISAPNQDSSDAGTKATTATKVALEAAVDAPSSSHTTKQKDPDKWHAKYNDLFALRFTKAESEYEDYRKSAEERFRAADDLIESLRKEIGELKLQAKKKQESNSASTASTIDEITAELQQRSANEKELEKQVALLTQKIDALTQDVLLKDETLERLEKHRRLTETSTDYNLREKLKTIQEVTGLAIEDVVAEDEGVSYMCKQTGPNASASYVLTVFDDLPNDYQYTPYGATASLDALPNYLKEPMSFERPSASMFYWRLCDHLHETQQETLSPVPQQAPAPAPEEQVESITATSSSAANSAEKTPSAAPKLQS